MFTRLSVVAFLKSCAQHSVGAGHRDLIHTAAGQDARLLIARVDQFPQQRPGEGLSNVAVDDANGYTCSDAFTSCEE
jgi:hypothetical protein